MIRSHSKKVVRSGKPREKAIAPKAKGLPALSDPTQEFKNAEPLDVKEEMMENVFDRDPESR